MHPVLALTCGEPAGIGPEVSLRAAWSLRAEVRSVLFGDAAFLSGLAADIDPGIRLLAITGQALLDGGLPQVDDTRLLVVDCPAVEPIFAGQLDARNAKSVILALDRAVAAVQRGQMDAIVTAPLQKSTINEAGIPFTGHTEYLAQKTGADQVVMMLAGGEPLLRVALATTHLPLKDVAAAIDRLALARTIEIIHLDLQHKFGIEHPRILVAGLNPHAGEGGYLGREEIEVISPVLEQMKARGISVLGPYPADTLFQPKYLQDADCVLAMYHDQGLPVLKHVSFGRGVNITLGLPVIRTSVDHGTALDLARRGVGHADCGSMIEAMRQAAAMARASAAYKKAQ